jgi:hypothetical protein
MSELLINNFKFTRGKFVNYVVDLEEGIAGVQPEGFNNTIHWHVGHVLTVAEQMMFGFPKKSTQLPDQSTRINEIPAESFNQRLKTPFLGQETFGELANFAIFHESIHLGQMQAMKRVIKTAVK